MTQRLLLKRLGRLASSRGSGQSERFEVAFEVVRQLDEMRKLAPVFPGEPVCERPDWTQNPEGSQRRFCWGGEGRRGGGQSF